MGKQRPLGRKLVLVQYTGVGSKPKPSRGDVKR